MYAKEDPRHVLQPSAGTAKAACGYVGAEVGLFYQDPPQVDDQNGRTWITRGQNAIVLYSEARQGGRFERRGQGDEYVLLVPDRDTKVKITTTAGTEVVPGYSLAFIPPGDSTIEILTAGRLVRLFTARSEDIAAGAANADSFTQPHPTVPAFVPWPAPEGGLKLRVYSLDVPVTPGRFGRIFRCTTFMVNYLDPRVGPRDRTMVSPHHHADFEQCSLVLEGDYIHHLRWPWTPNMNDWREDQHLHCGAPSVCVIPPPVIHTSTSEAPGLNQLVDIFSPPRRDFSVQPGWVLNEADYPLPPQ
jgi:hypothetical protein